MNGLHFGVRFWTPKRGSFCRQNCCHRAKKCTRQKFPIPLGFQGFAAPRVLVLHTLRTFMSTHVLEPVQEHVRTYMLAGRGRRIARGAAKSWKPSGMQNLSRTRGNNRNLHYFSKKLPTKRPPFWGPFLDPKTGAKSPGQANQIETE